MPVFNPHCTTCTRLANFLSELRIQYPVYHNQPVAPFGELTPRLFIVGLAPGLHGANATGRPFTGDQAGTLLYQTLHKFGFATHAESLSADDSLKLIDCRITNAVKCLPPQNRPLGNEVNRCNPYLKTELDMLPQKAIILVLGGVAHNAVLKALGLRLSDYKFAHHALHELPQGNYLLDTYHCSRYNVNTKRLTPAMFEAVFATARDLLERE